MLKFFAEKNVSSFCSTHIFSAKNIRILYIESAKTVNEMTLNELVKLTTLWTTWPRLEVLPRQVVRLGPVVQNLTKLLHVASAMLKFLSWNKVNTLIFAEKHE